MFSTVEWADVVNCCTTAVSKKEKNQKHYINLKNLHLRHGSFAFIKQIRFLNIETFFLIKKIFSWFCFGRKYQLICWPFLLSVSKKYSNAFRFSALHQNSHPISYRFTNTILIPRPMKSVQSCVLCELRRCTLLIVLKKLHEKSI